MDKDVVNLFCVSLILGFVYLVTRKKPNEFRVIKKSDETGTEVRFNGRSVYLHVTDQVKFDAHLEKKRKEVLGNI